MLQFFKNLFSFLARMLSALTVIYVAAFYDITLVSNQGDTKEDKDQIRISLNHDRCY